MGPTKKRAKHNEERLGAAGLKPIQLWIPDPQTPGFAEECRRQSMSILNDPAEMGDLERLVDIAGWGGE